MNGFYLTVDPASIAEVRLSATAFGEFCNRTKLDKNTLYIFADSPANELCAAGGWKIYSLGVPVYRESWGASALNALLGDQAGKVNLQELLRSLRGQFCLAGFHADQHKVFVATDAFAAVPIYELSNAHQLQFSNILPLLLRFNRVSLASQPLAEYLSMDYCISGTLFDEIRVVDPGELVLINGNVSRQAYDNAFSGLEFGKHTDLDSTATLVRETFLGNLSFLHPEDKIFADLTGGLDTRTAAAALKYLNVPFTTGLCGEQILGEKTLAAQAAQALDVPFEAEFQIRRHDVFRRAVETHFDIGSTVPVLYYASELIHYYERIRERHGVHVSGFAGTQIFTFEHNIKDTSLFTSRLHIPSTVERGFSFLDVLPSQRVTRESYYRALGLRVRELLLRIGSDRYVDVANYLALAIYIRYHHSTLQGVHDCILPLYTPYLERNLVRLLMETGPELKRDDRLQRAVLAQLHPSAAAIMTTHGYSAQPGFQIRRDLFVRGRRHLKDHLRRSVYRFAMSRKALRHLREHILPRTGAERPDARRMADFDRQFWAEEVRALFSMDMCIIRLLDPNKLRKLLAAPGDYNVLLAKLLYVERLVRSFNVRVDV